MRARRITCMSVGVAALMAVCGVTGCEKKVDVASSGVPSSAVVSTTSQRAQARAGMDAKIVGGATPNASALTHTVAPSGKKAPELVTFVTRNNAGKHTSTMTVYMDGQTSTGVRLSQNQLEDIQSAIGQSDVASGRAKGFNTCGQGLTDGGVVVHGRIFMFCSTGSEQSDSLAMEQAKTLSYVQGDQ